MWKIDCSVMFGEHKIEKINLFHFWREKRKKSRNSQARQLSDKHFLAGFQSRFPRLPCFSTLFWPDEVKLLTNQATEQATGLIAYLSAISANVTFTDSKPHLRPNWPKGKTQRNVNKAVVSRGKGGGEDYWPESWLGLLRVYLRMEYWNEWISQVFPQ